MLFISGCAAFPKQPAAVVDNVAGKFVAATVDAQAAPDLMKRLRVSIYPTTVIISPEASVIEHVGGFMSPQLINSKLASATKKLDDTQIR